MRRSLLTVMAVFMLVLPIRVGAFDMAASAPKELPAIVMLDDDGFDISLDSFLGKVVVLNLWATWCAPCRHEMPSLDRLQVELGGDDFKVVALSVDRGDGAKVRKFLDEVDASHLDIYRDPKATATRALKAPGLPTTIVIDRRGHEIGRVLGAAEWDSDAAKAVLREIIAR